MCCTEVPGKPEGPLELEGATILKWQAPITDGGAPILKYIVEQEDPTKSQTFVELPKQNPNPEPRIDLEDNLPVETYENVVFRITAVNLKGQSQPLEETISLNKTGKK